MHISLKNFIFQIGGYLNSCYFGKDSNALVLKQHVEHQ